MPSSAASRSSSPRRPEPRATSAPPTPSSTTSTVRLPLCALDGHRRVRRARVLGDVGERLGDDEIGGALHRAGQPRSHASTVTGTGARATSDCSAGSSPRSVSTAGWMPRASSRSSARLVRSSSCAWSSRPASLRVVAGAPARGPQQQRQRDEPRLRAVVEVALEPPPRRVARLHQPRARRAQLLHPLGELVVEVGDVAAQQTAEERERHQPGGDERRPPGDVAGARARHGHEQERAQRAHVDRRDLQALERVGAAPALAARAAARPRTARSRAAPRTR